MQRSATALSKIISIIYILWYNPSWIRCLTASSAFFMGRGDSVTLVHSGMPSMGCAKITEHRDSWLTCTDMRIHKYGIQRYRTIHIKQ